MTVLTEQAADAAIVAAAATLALPTVRTQAGEIADAAARDQLTHRGYLAELLLHHSLEQSFSKCPEPAVPT